MKAAGILTGTYRFNHISGDFMPSISIGPVSIFVGSSSTPFGTPFAIEWRLTPRNLPGTDNPRQGNVGKIDWRGVALGGLLAGVILDVAEAVTNVVILGARWEAWGEKVGVVTNQPFTGRALALWTLSAFALGVISMWMYAAVRPRLGPGPRPAIIVALVIWIIYWPLATLQDLAFSIVPIDLLIIRSIGGLVGMIAALFAGASAYREDSFN